MHDAPVALGFGLGFGLEFGLEFGLGGLDGWTVGQRDKLAQQAPVLTL
jgi:hypothetical protein